MTKERARCWSLYVLAAVMFACASEPSAPGVSLSSPPAGALHVLFVGNSATYFNDLPGMLERMGRADGQPLETVDVSQGGFALEYHWNTGAARQMLDDGRWDVVVLQQGPSSTPEKRENLVMWAGIWANASRARGARPALFMIWPTRARLNEFPDVILSYHMAAEAAHTELYAVGEAWQAAWQTDPTLPFYGPDDVHPSVIGSYLAALTIYRGMRERVPPSLTGLGISAEDDAVLQAAASAAQPFSQ